MNLPIDGPFAARVTALRHKRSIRNGRLGEIKGQDDLKAIGFGPLQGDALGGSVDLSIYLEAYENWCKPLI